MLHSYGTLPTAGSRFITYAAFRRTAISDTNLCSSNTS